MGNRAVITTKENFDNNGIGVYLHWNGGRDSVNAFLTYCKMKGYRAPEEDSYGWARLVQVISNFFEGGLSIGIDTVSNLDCNNGDNGVYFIENWKIVDRKYFSGSEQNEYDLNEMLVAIDEAQPSHEQFGKEYLQGSIINPAEMQIGEVIAFLDWKNEIVKAKIIGFGGDKMVNGSKVKGVPYVCLYGDQPELNINNYLFDNREYRKLN